MHSAPSIGQLRLAHNLLKSGRSARRRRLPPIWRHVFDGAVVVTFVFFLFM